MAGSHARDLERHVGESTGEKLCVSPGQGRERRENEGDKQALTVYISVSSRCRPLNNN